MAENQYEALKTYVDELKNHRSYSRVLCDMVSSLREMEALVKDDPDPKYRVLIEQAYEFLRNPRPR